jgi:hypothetical protein
MYRFAITLTAAIWIAQISDRMPVDMEAPPILYTSGTLHDPVAELNRNLTSGSAHLAYDNVFGYLPAVLDALNISRESQLLVFSKTSLQSILISPANPRAIYFNDSAAVAWVRGSPTLEVAAQDPQQGAIFYTLDQSVQTRPVLTRERICLGCHRSVSSLDVPGMVVRTVFPAATGTLVTGLIGSEVDHRTPFDERWGGWYVTGKHSPLRHLANAVVLDVQDANATTDARVPTVPQTPSGSPIREPLQEHFSTSAFPTPYSDIASLAVFEHQMHMMNLITRVGWESRAAFNIDPTGHSDATVKTIRESAREFVDYLLFVDEAPMTTGIEGTSGFAAKFASQGPLDSKGRGLRQLDLEHRLMRYPCSYMIYSEAFKSLNAPVHEAIYRRMWEVLSGQEQEMKYRRLSPEDRKAVVEILRETVKDLPEYFKP